MGLTARLLLAEEQDRFGFVASLEESAAHGDTSQRDSVRCPIGLPMAIARFPARKHLASVVIVGAQREGGWAPAT